MTRSGYISDRNCPSNPAHGVVYGMRSGGYYCPHEEHTSKDITKDFWHEDEFEAAKTEPVPDPTKPVAIRTPKPKKRKSHVRNTVARRHKTRIT